MADVLSTHSRARAELGSKIAEKLIRELDPHMCDHDKMVSFVPHVIMEGDENAIKALYGAEIVRDAVLAVQEYCDWVATSIVLSKGYAARPLPSPDVITMAKMVARRDIRPLTLVYVIAQLREEDALPLLGRIDQGCLIPDQAEIDAWKACFDWSGTPAA